MKELQELANQDDDVKAADQQASVTDIGLVSISTPTMRLAEEASTSGIPQPRASFFTPPPSSDKAGPQQAAAEKVKEVERLQSRGYDKRKEGDLSRAIQYYSRAIDLDQANFKSFFYRGFAYHSSGDCLRAIQDYS